MFKLTYRPSYNKHSSNTEYFDDKKSLGQALINIVNNEKEEQLAMDWCGRAHHGDKVVRSQFDYKLECFNETILKEKAQLVADEISAKSGIANSFIGWKKDSLTWSFNLGETYMQFHDQYGYHILIDANGTLGTYMSKSKRKFIVKIFQN